MFSFMCFLFSSFINLKELFYFNRSSLFYEKKISRKTFFSFGNKQKKRGGKGHINRLAWLFTYNSMKFEWLSHTDGFVHGCCGCGHDSRGTLLKAMLFYPVRRTILHKYHNNFIQSNSDWIFFRSLPYEYEHVLSENHTKQNHTKPDQTKSCIL